MNCDNKLILIIIIIIVRQFFYSSISKFNSLYIILYIAKSAGLSQLSVSLYNPYYICVHLFVYTMTIMYIYIGKQHTPNHATIYIGVL